MMTIAANRRTARIAIRVRAEDKELIETAAHELGLSVSDFILTSMRERAEDIVQRQRTIQLTAEESRVFCTLLLQEPVEAPPALAEAMAQHKKIVDSR